MRLPWGARICLFYETDQDLVEATSSFMQAGLDRNEFGLWMLPDEISRDVAIGAMRTAIAGFDRFCAAGAIEVQESLEQYRASAPFSFKKHVEAHIAGARGFAGMRGAGTALWVADHEWDTYVQYEAQITEALAGEPAMMLCTYKLSGARASDLADVAQFHQILNPAAQGAMGAARNPRHSRPGNARAR